jgi:prepilin-type N-terminal cleavage/methylation domain-containing protein
MKRAKGFTLLELLISSAIFVVVLVVVYSSFQTGIFGYRGMEERISLYQTARLVLDRMDRDLRNSFAFSSEEAKFLGGPSEVSFLSLTDTYTQAGMAEEYSQVSFKAENKKLTRLCRRNKESLNKNSAALAQEMSAGVEELSLEYGYEDPKDKTFKFKNTWASASDPEEERKTLPKAVRIKLRLKERASQDFQRTIYLRNDE